MTAPDRPGDRDQQQAAALLGYGDPAEDVRARRPEVARVAAALAGARAEEAARWEAKIEALCDASDAMPRWHGGAHLQQPPPRLAGRRVTAGRRDQLASALRGQLAEMSIPPGVISTGLVTPWSATDLAEALLPTVDAMIRQAQAEALESAADLADIVPMHAAEHLRARAAALLLTTDRPDVTQDAP